MKVLKSVACNPPLLAKSDDGSHVAIAEVVLIFEESEYKLDSDGEVSAVPIVTAVRFMADESALGRLVESLTGISGELAEANLSSSK